MQQILALQVNLRPAQLLRKPPRKKKRRRPPRISPQQLLQPCLKFPVALRPLILALQFLKRRHERLRHIPPPINPKPPRLIDRTNARGAPPLSRLLRQGGEFDFSRGPHFSRVLGARSGDFDFRIPCNRSHPSLPFRSISRTARTNSRTFSGSFFPGRASTPDATSTPQGFKILIASPTLSMFKPPAITTGCS